MSMIVVAAMALSFAVGAGLLVLAVYIAWTEYIHPVYVKTCWTCKVTHTIHGKRKLRNFMERTGGRCPECGAPYMNSPLPPYRIPTPKKGA